MAYCAPRSAHIRSCELGCQLPGAPLPAAGCRLPAVAYDQLAFTCHQAPQHNTGERDVHA